LGKKRLIVVSHGALQYLPFAALPVPSSAGTNASSRLLLEDHEIVGLPSAGVLAALRSDNPKLRQAQKMVAILADPVFSSEDPRFAERKPEGPIANLLPSEELRESLADSSTSGLRRLRFSRVEANAIASLVSASNRFVAVDFEASRTTALSPNL